MPLEAFIPAVTPTFFRPTHLRPVLSLIEQADRGQELRACVSVPPQHGKTEAILHGVAWLFLRHPTWRIGYASYNAGQARDKSRRARDLALSLGLRIRQDADSKELWELTSGGAFVARGIGEGLTGQGLQGIIVDDPHKDRTEAESPAERRAVRDWFYSVALTRIPPTGFVIVVHTRWHPDDLIGSLTGPKAPPGRWAVVNLPAINADGLALCERLWPRGYLEKRHEDIGDYEWASLYCGQPAPPGGQVFRDSYFCERRDGLRYSIGVDMAYTAKSHADYSVAVVLGELDGLYDVVEVRREQVEARVFMDHLAAIRLRYPGAPMRWYCSGTEKGVADLMNRSADLGMAAIPATKDKMVRALPAGAAWNAGKIRIARDAANNAPPWASAFLGVVLGFTGVGDKVDDDVDALAAAYDALAGPQPSALWL